MAGDELRKILILKLCLVALSITFSIFTTTSMIQKNQEFSFEEDLGFINVPIERKIVLGKIECKSDFYIMPAKNDNLKCNLFLENKGDSVILRRISIFGTGGPKADEIYEFEFNQDQRINTTVYIRLPDSRDYSIFWHLDTNSSYYSNGNKGLRLEEPSVASAEKNERQRVIYLILTSAISLSILGIFTGINNFRQIWQSGKNPKQQKKI